MNYYIVVEGAVEKKVYSKWIPIINPSLRQIHSLGMASQNSFMIFDGGGYPNIIDMIEAGVSDVMGLADYRLVVIIDSEDETRQNKYDEIESLIKGKAAGVNIDYAIIVQHYCFETWALGNRKIVPANPNNRELVEYMRHFHVRKNDPELLTVIPGKELTRAQFAETYLRKLLQQKFHQTYTKRNPEAVTHPAYLSELRKRLIDTGHINSFEKLLTTFSPA